MTEKLYDKRTGLVLDEEAAATAFDYPSFDEYQARARATAVYPRLRLDVDLGYVLLGLLGEAGELANKYKKILRDKGGIVSAQDWEDLFDELGDVLWYVSNIASELDADLGEVAKVNLKKLESRQERGKLQGDGDKR